METKLHTPGIILNTFILLLHPVPLLKHFPSLPDSLPPHLPEKSRLLRVINQTRQSKIH